MEFDKMELSILAECVNNEYETKYTEYKNNPDSFSFARLVDIELLRKKIYTELNRR